MALVSMLIKYRNAEFLKELNSSDGLIFDQKLKFHPLMHQRWLFVTVSGCRSAVYHEYISCE